MAGTSNGSSGGTPSQPSNGRSRPEARESGGTPASNTMRPSATPAREGRGDPALPPKSRRRGARSARDNEELPEKSSRRDPASPRAGVGASKGAENSIRPTPRPIRGASAPVREHLRSNSRGDEDARAKARRSAPSSSNVDEPERKLDRDSMPEEVKRRFVQIGNKYHFPDGARAFTDHGSRLTSPSENTEVIKSLVSIAQARGWSEISVTGTERFRKEAWFAARIAGLDVRNYKPTEFEQGRLVRALARRQDQPVPDRPATTPSVVDGKSADARNQPEVRTNAHNEPRERQRTLQVGRLVDHGVAPYLHDSRNTTSYFVRIETEGSERVIWGVDLQRALKESLTRPQIGDEIGLRSGRREAVKVWQLERDSDGRVVDQKQIATHRNAWIVEKRDFFRERAQASRVLRDEGVDQQQAVKRHPELVGTYLQLHAAELAAKNIRDPEDQRRFVASVRRALADSVARGEPLPPVRLKDAATQRSEPRAPSPPAPSAREAAPVR